MFDKIKQNKKADNILHLRSECMCFNLIYAIYKKPVFGIGANRILTLYNTNPEF